MDLYSLLGPETERENLPGDVAVTVAMLMAIALVCH